MKTRKFADSGGTLDDTLPPDSGLAQALNQPGNDPEGLYKYIRQMTATKPAKPKVVTKEQLQEFKAKYGADKDLTDYMNAQKGLTRRLSKSTLPGEDKNPNTQAMFDTIDYGEVLQSRETGRTRGGPSYDSAGKPSNAGPDVEYKPQSLNKRTGATAKMMSDFNNQANKITGRGYASGGAVSASRRGDGIAQRGKTRGKVC